MLNSINDLLSYKEQFTQKMKICSHQAIEVRSVCFISDKFSITSLAHQWILCSEWVPSESESKQLIETKQK